MSGAWTLFVCGDRSRGDDGAAHAAVDRLIASLPRAVEVRRVGQLEPDDLVAALRRGSCLVVDTVRGIGPGAIVGMPLARIGVSGPASASSHSLPLGTVVALAEALGGDVERARFLGIGGERFGLGERLSGSVRRSLDRYANAIAWIVDANGAPPCA
jgi:hydrogenase maturation protease